MTNREKLFRAAAAYDRRRINRPGYNVYALAQYYARLEDTFASVSDGALIGDGTTLEQALRANFNDRLLDSLLKAIR